MGNFEVRVQNPYSNWSSLKHPVGVRAKPSRFVHIGYVCRKAAHYVRYQTP